MRDVNIWEEKKATEIYIKGLLQDFVNNTGLPIADVQVETGVNPITNTREIRNVRVLSDIEVPAVAFA